MALDPKCEAERQEIVARLLAVEGFDGREAARVIGCRQEDVHHIVFHLFETYGWSLTLRVIWRDYLR